MWNGRVIFIFNFLNSVKDLFNTTGKLLVFKQIDTFATRVYISEKTYFVNCSSN